jgi:hypothetical protein
LRRIVQTSDVLDDRAARKILRTGNGSARRGEEASRGEQSW